MDISTVIPVLASLIVVGALAGFLAGLLEVVGATVGHPMDAGPLKRLFGAFLLLVAANMVRSALWP